jgi:hypothetical protein
MTADGAAVDPVDRTYSLSRFSGQRGWPMIDPDEQGIS